MNATPLASNKRWPLWLGLAGLAIVTYLLAHSKADFDAYANSHSGSDSSSPPKGPKADAVDHDRSWAFNEIYNTNEWSSPESKSGKGSEMRYTERIRKLLDFTIEKYGIKSLSDGPCGDFAWQHSLHNFPHINYTGMDIVSAIILGNSKKHTDLLNARFINLDLVLDPLPKSEAYLVRDVVQHLSLDDGVALLRNVERTGAKYLISNFHNMKGTGEPVPNRNIEAGRFYPNHLMLEPFNFPPPLYYILDMHDGYFEREKDDMGIKLAAVWELPALGRGDGTGFHVDYEAAKDIVGYE